MNGANVAKVVRYLTFEQYVYDADSFIHRVKSYFDGKETIPVFKPNTLKSGTDTIFTYSDELLRSSS